MIAFISGVLVSKTATRAVIRTAGVGLEALIPLSTFEKLPDPGAAVTLQTHLHVREDALSLIGFFSIEEKELFQMLVSVNGIGIKLALGILSGCKIADLYKYLAEGNEANLTRIPGLGKKTAQRLILDLKDKAAAQLGKIAADFSMPARLNRDMLEEAIQAMISLGYTRPEALRSIEKAAHALGEEASIEKLLRQALQG
ncbi:MAG TPA: Holliday junction branch migration protein RuvA [bacterium]|nr:Holliday junction branch migration protein RuvA [bacterium]